MSAPGVRVRGVSKKFRKGEHHDSLRSVLSAFGRSLLSRPTPVGPADREFWAVRDVSFDVMPGQALGIIGSNGAGKSTLLKLITRVLRPTAGTVEVRGRQGALIELAAGFHPDLTGRENVVLQGTIMGMSPSDIARKFDQIIDFAGVSEFVDTPVKRYSSGMNARLGFSIAAHLDPDVLFIDEVLSVGDVGFQQKAFGRIQELVSSGIPVVVVSHQLERISQLCTHAILLDHGAVACQGTPRECIAAYLNPSRAGHVALPDAPAVIERMTLCDDGPTPSGGWLRLRVEGRVLSSEMPDYIDPVLIAVQSADNGATLTAIASAASGLTLREGPFVLDVELQMNVPRGFYNLQSVVWNRRLEKPIVAGPSIIVPVEAGPQFTGLVQLNGRMSVAPLADAGVAAARLASVGLCR